jgi:hypothetical protein
VFKHPGWTRGYFGRLDPDTATNCGRKFTITSAAPSGPDNGAAWYYGGLDPDTLWIASGSSQPGGNYPVTITVDSAIQGVQIVFQFSPAPGSKATLYDAGNVAIDSFIVPAVQDPSPYPDQFDFHTQVSHTFLARGVRKIRMEAPGASGATSWFLNQLFFIPDTVLCPPYNNDLIDSAVVRRELEDLLLRSNAFNNDFTQRREYASFVFRNPDGSYRIVPHQYQLRTCGGQIVVDPPMYADPTFVAILHSHPFNDGDVAPCDGGPLQYPPYKQGGGSDPDYDSMNKINLIRGLNGRPKVRWIVVDKQQIWLMDPNATVFQAVATAKPHPRVDVGCVRPF